MKTILYTLLAGFLFSCCACSKKSGDATPDIAIPDTCDGRFYYYWDQTINLGTYSDTLTVGFRPGTTVAQIRATLKKYPFVKAIDEAKLSAAPKFVFVTIGGFADCAMVLPLMQRLKNDENITYANQLLYLRNARNNTREALGLTDEFVVGLKDPADLPVLEDFAKTTNSKIREKSTSYYLLTVDKYNTKDALEMANYFHDSRLFYYAEPNFLTTVSPL
ncbi:MAG TPA: hypothetical protein VL092_07655 [Chitinophagaceae bacterium]|nr:hypothetical protein [Chitinophagaceae bacterium]